MIVVEGIFKLKYKKKNSGEHFEGLDLLTKLLTPNCAPHKLASNLIEEVDGAANDKQDEGSTGNAGEDDDEEEDEIQWYIDQKVSNEEDDSDIKLICSDIKYGFAQTKSNVFSKLSVSYISMIVAP